MEPAKVGRVRVSRTHLSDIVITQSVSLMDFQNFHTFTMALLFNGAIDKCVYHIAFRLASLACSFVMHIQTNLTLFLLLSPYMLLAKKRDNPFLFAGILLSLDKIGSGSAQPNFENCVFRLSMRSPFVIFAFCYYIYNINLIK